MNEKITNNTTPVVKKFLLVSTEGQSAELGLQLTKEGSEVKMYIEEPEERKTGDGFVEKCEDWLAWKDWADVIIFDDVGSGELADKLREEGKFIVGGSRYTDRLEDDREFGQDEIKRAGINILPHWDFTNFDDAIKFVTEHPERYVIKPSGRAQEEKHLTFIGEDDDGMDVLRVLEQYKKTWSKKIKTFQIQKHVTGVEIAIGAYFNGKDFLTPININFEHKRLFPGNLGPPTGEMGTSMFWTQPNALFQNTLAKLKDKLAEAKYAGYIDINCIANGRGVYPLELTARFGYPTLQIHMEGIQSKWTDLMYALGAGEQMQIKTKKGYQVGVVVATAPFPFYDPDAFTRFSEDAVVIFKKPMNEGVHIMDIRKVEEEWLLTGHIGYALIITGSGNTMERARQQTYMRISNISIPNMFYRTDIGERWGQDSDLLHTWGYL